MQELPEREIRLDGASSRSWLIAAAVGVVGFVAAAILATGADDGKTVFFQSYLTNFMFFLSLALGGLFFVMVTYLTRAGWSVALRRLAEIVAWTLLPLTFLALVIVFGMHELYEWTHEEVVAGDALLQHKAAWLNPTFFLIRLGFYFLVWNVLAGVFLSRSVKQDQSGDPAITVELEKFAAPGTIAYALTVTFASFDLIMSLYPHWYSTIFGVYYFAGSIVGFFSLIPLILFMLRRWGKLGRIVNASHFHDVGKLIFAFVVFWAYIAFSQYFLIWYGNIPEETAWYELRQGGFWVYFSVILLVGHFIMPFLFLISRHPKRRSGVLLLAALWILLMHWFDLFYLTMPEARSTGFPLKWMDLACFIGLGGIFVSAALWRMGGLNLVPVQDPRLAESLRLENV